MRYASHERTRAREAEAYRVYVTECMRALVGADKGYRSLLEAPAGPIDVDATIERVARAGGLEVI